MNTSPIRATRRALLGAGAGFALAGCATRAATPATAAIVPLRHGLVPLRLSPERLMRITVCTRPFRAAGPRLEVETLGSKRLVHNYGHGGSGWSLAWGYAEAAARLALAESPASVAVIGAGALGLTAATRIAETGVAVTIYAADLPPETRSARATGTWSPDSRVALSDAAPAGFAETWEALARKSFAAHQAYVGLDGHPVEWTERYMLSDGLPSARPTEVQGFFAQRIQGLMPAARPLEPHEHPFPVARARRNAWMTFNVAEYAHRLVTDFQLMGGRVRRARFGAPTDLMALPEPVIVNCTGYGARALFGDESLTPVRGQIAWLAPQEEALYGVYYRHVSVLARRDGIVIQETGEDDRWGWAIADETPDRVEFEAALAKVAPLFAGWG